MKKTTSGKGMQNLCAWASIIVYVKPDQPTPVLITGYADVERLSPDTFKISMQVYSRDSAGY